MSLPTLLMDDPAADGDNSTAIVVVTRFVSVHANVLTRVILYMVILLLVGISALLGKRRRWGCLFALTIIMVPILVRHVSNLGEVDCLEETLCVDEMFAYRAFFSLILFLEMTLSLYRWADQVPAVDGSGGGRTVVNSRAMWKAVAVAAGVLVLQMLALAWVYSSHSATVATVQIGVCGVVFAVVLFYGQLLIKKAMTKIGNADCAQTAQRRRRMFVATWVLLCLSALFDTLASLVGAATSVSSNAAVEMLHRIAVMFIMASAACTAFNRETRARDGPPREDDPNEKLWGITDDDDGETDNVSKQRALNVEYARVAAHQTPTQTQPPPPDSVAIELLPATENKHQSNGSSKPSKGMATHMTRSFLRLGLWWSPFSLGECQEVLAPLSGPSRVLYQLLTAMSKTHDPGVVERIAAHLRRMSYDELKDVQNMLVTNAAQRPDAAVQELIRVYLFLSEYSHRQPATQPVVLAMFHYLETRLAGKQVATDGDQTLRSTLKTLHDMASLPVPALDKAVYRGLVLESKKTCFIGSHTEVERKFETPAARIQWLLEENEFSSTSELKMEMESIQAIVQCGEMDKAIQVSDLLATGQTGVKTVTEQLAEALQTMHPYYHLVLCSDFHTTLPIHALVSWYTSNSDAALRIHQRAFKHAGILATPPPPQAAVAAAAAASASAESKYAVIDDDDNDPFAIGVAEVDEQRQLEEEEETGLTRQGKTSKEDLRKWDNAMRHLLVICILAIRTSKDSSWMNVFVHTAVSRIPKLRAKILLLNDYYRGQASDFLLSFEVSTSPALKSCEPARKLLLAAWTDFRPGLMSLEASVQQRIQSITAADTFQAVHDALNAEVSRQLPWLPMDTFIRIENQDICVANVLALELASKSDADRRRWAVFCTLLLIAFFAEAEYGIKLATSLGRWLKDDTRKFLSSLSMLAGIKDTNSQKALADLAHRCVGIPLHVCNPFAVV